MDFLQSILLFCFGYIFGIFWFGMVFLPLIYGFPKSLWLVFQQQLRWSTPLKYLFYPIFWSTVITLILVVGLSWAPNAIVTLAENAVFNIAQICAVGISILRCLLSAQGRRDLRDDFDAFTAPYRL